MVRTVCVCVGGGGRSTGRGGEVRGGGLCPVDPRQIYKILFSTKGSFPKNMELPAI